MSGQFIRKCSLVVIQGDQALDLSELRISFQVYAADTETPNSVAIRVYNLSDATSRQVQNEYSRVVLNAGYENGNFGVIFDGTIKEVRRGRLNATNKFCDIFAADGDLNYNFSTISATLAAGASQADQLAALKGAFAQPTGGINVSYGAGVTTAPPNLLPRGKVLYGMTRARMRNLAKTHQWSWSIQNGVLTVIPFQSYLPGEAVVLTSKTGMIGLPTQTQQGIYIRCLLNPKIAVGGLIQIDEASIVPAPINLQYAAINSLPSLSADGFYRAYVVEHEGDTRGQEWYTNLTCLSVDATQPIADSVRPYG